MSQHLLNLPTESDLRSSYRLANELNHTRSQSPYPYINPSRPLSANVDKHSVQTRLPEREWKDSGASQTLRRPSAQALQEFRRGLDRSSLKTHARRRGDSLPDKALITPRFATDEKVAKDVAQDDHAIPLQHADPQCDHNERGLSNVFAWATHGSEQCRWTYGRISDWLSTNHFDIEWQYAMLLHAVQHEDFLALTSFSRVRKIAPAHLLSTEEPTRLCNLVRALLNSRETTYEERKPKGSTNLPEVITAEKGYRVSNEVLQQKPQRSSSISKSHKISMSEHLGNWQQIENLGYSKTADSDALKYPPHKFDREDSDTNRIADWALQTSQHRQHQTHVPENFEVLSAPTPQEIVPNLSPDISETQKQRKIVLVTSDHVNYTAVTLNPDQPQQYCAQIMVAGHGSRDSSIYVTAIGGAMHGEALTETQITYACIHADYRGLSVFYVKPASTQLKSPDADGNRLEKARTLTRFIKEDKGDVSDNVKSLLPTQKKTSFESVRYDAERISSSEPPFKKAQTKPEATGFKVLRSRHEIDFDSPRSSPFRNVQCASEPKAIGRNDSSAGLIAHRAAPKLPKIVTQDRIARTLTRARRSAHLVGTPDRARASRNPKRLTSPARSPSRSPSSDDGLWAVRPRSPELNLGEKSAPHVEGKKSSPGQRSSQSPSHPDSGRSVESAATAITEVPASIHDELHNLKESSSNPAVLNHAEPVDAASATIRPSGPILRDGLRPPTELVYEYLTEFFPAHDLDRPILQTVAEHSDGRAPDKHENGVGTTDTAHRMKSIRVVASEANEARKRFHSAAQGVRAVNLLRRRSTRLWGAKVIEVTPKASQRSEPIAVHPSKDVPDHVTFRWLKGQLIGKGQFGHVYLAMNLTTGDMLAVKQVALVHHGLCPAIGEEGSLADSLNIEIENMRDLDHINIVQYLGFERDASNISIFLEYVSGGSIGDCLRRYGRFEPDLIQSLTRQTLEGLQYLHERSILHRDLKADNLLLDVDGTCKISDFGISKRSRDAYGNDANMSMQGTIFWMAPEVIDNKKQGYSAKIDIWSLGCLVLEMFAGRRPWSSEEAISVLYTLGKGTAPPVPEDVLPYMDANARSFLDACFTIDPVLRPTASELLGYGFCQIKPAFDFRKTELGAHLKVVASMQSGGAV